MFKRLINKDDRQIYERHEQRVSRAEEELQKLGFKYRTHFEDRKVKVEAYTSQEWSFNEQAIKQVTTDYEELIKAETIIQGVEIRAIAAEYPNWSGADHLNHEGAVSIKGINEKLKRVVPLSNIKTMYQQCGEQLQELQHKINGMNKTQSRLNTAHQWLEKYEKQLSPTLVPVMVPKKIMIE